MLGGGDMVKIIIIISILVVIYRYTKWAIRRNKILYSHRLQDCNFMQILDSFSSAYVIYWLHDVNPDTPKKFLSTNKGLSFWKHYTTFLHLPKTFAQNSCVCSERGCKVIWWERKEWRRVKWGQMIQCGTTEHKQMQIYKELKRDCLECLKIQISIYFVCIISVTLVEFQCITFRQLRP